MLMMSALYRRAVCQLVGVRLGQGQLLQPGRALLVLPLQESHVLINHLDEHHLGTSRSFDLCIVCVDSGALCKMLRL